MLRVTPVLPEKAGPELKPLYEALEKKMGRVINIFQNMGNSPLTLKAFLALSEAAAHTHLSAKVREEIALTIGQANQCEYCVSAHTLSAKAHGIPEQEILLARKGEAQEPKTKAILKFVKIVVEKRGKVSEEDVAALKNEGVSDQELIEIVLNIAVNMFTNYFNNIIGTQVDFPEAPPLT
ncbi:carboxymuconolactone decarboxylase family protein [Neochlamydia sp. EPS4]|uniref:carboxymuconolactone decarboxylase family protein n=1 Tax=Neochlamydia sp. EPS4 TaxID=1478175 RepID=UPI0005D1157E|nr:carboxymuconolactone decarboxylase family protein [Neochlamydia sp. EPS4]